jgi:hypothetical protein
MSNYTLILINLGTLLAYSLVAESILIIRYNLYSNRKIIFILLVFSHSHWRYSNGESNDDKKSSDNSLEKHSIVEKRDFKSIFRMILNTDRSSKPNELSSKIANSMITAISETPIN